MFCIGKYCCFSFYLCIFLVLFLGMYNQINAMNVDKDTYKKDLHKIYNFVCVTNEKDMKKLCLKLKQSKAFALDTETTGFNPLKCDCIGISVCIKEGEAFYIPFGHKVNSEQLTKKQIVKYLKPIFEDTKITKYFHHAVFDMIFLYTIGIDVKGPIFCSLFASNCIGSKSGRHGLKRLSEEYFGETMISFKQAVLDNGYKDFSQLPLDLANKYAAADAHQTLKLCKVLKKKLEKKENIHLTYYTKLLPQIKVDYQNVKKKFLDKNGEGIKKYMKEIYDRLHKIKIIKSVKKIKNNKKKRIYNKNEYEPKNKKRKYNEKN
ncbi:hypothetical protein ACFLYU_01935 [Candidatus Dependentiae bacterium]